MLFLNFILSIHQVDLTHWINYIGSKWKSWIYHKIVWCCLNYPHFIMCDACVFKVVTPLNPEEINDPMKYCKFTWFLYINSSPFTFDSFCFFGYSLACTQTAKMLKNYSGGVSFCWIAIPSSMLFSQNTLLHIAFSAILLVGYSWISVD